MNNECSSYFSSPVTSSSRVNDDIISTRNDTSDVNGVDVHRSTSTSVDRYLLYNDSSSSNTIRLIDVLWHNIPLITTGVSFSQVQTPSNSTCNTDCSGTQFLLSLMDEALTIVSSNNPVSTSPTNYNCTTNSNYAGGFIAPSTSSQWYNDNHYPIDHRNNDDEYQYQYQYQYEENATIVMRHDDNVNVDKNEQPKQ